MAPVGAATLGAGLWGQLDLAGDLAQWTVDWNAPYVNPCDDCAYLNEYGSYNNHVVRGSAYYVSLPTYTLPPPVRNASGPPPLGVSDVGFRCARTP